MRIVPEKWIYEPKENTGGLLLAHAEGGKAEFPLPVETHNVRPEAVKLGTLQEFEVILESASGLHVYADAEVYARTADSSFAAEAFVPCGLFSPAEERSFLQTATAILHGTVIRTCEDAAMYGFEPDDVLFRMTCLGYEFDAVVSGGKAEGIRPETGNTVCGIYWIQGWPKEDSYV